MRIAARKKNQQGRFSMQRWRAPPSKVGRAWYGQLRPSLAQDAVHTKTTSSLFSFHAYLLPYGAGTVMVLDRSVTWPVEHSTLPSTTERVPNEFDD